MTRLPHNYTASRHTSGNVATACTSNAPHINFIRHKSTEERFFRPTSHTTCTENLTHKIVILSFADMSVKFQKTQVLLELLNCRRASMEV